MEGLSMETLKTLLYPLLVITAIAAVALVVAAIREKIFFKMSLRNLFRRPSQTILTFVGLMLAAMIFSASFATGDTLTHSIRSMGVDILGEVDIRVENKTTDAVGTLGYFDESYVEMIDRIVAEESRVEGIAPVIGEFVPVEAPKSNLYEPTATLMGMDERYTDEFEPILDENGDTLALADLGDDSVYVGSELAEELEINISDEVNIFLKGEAIPFTVAGIMDNARNPVMTEYGDASKVDYTVVMPLTFMQSLTGKTGEINAILITLQGGIIDGAKHSDAVVDLLENDEELIVSGLSVDPFKEESLDAADEAGAGFASIFMMLGSFSIIAGILLIFLIFVMLAAERKRELGIARAVGTQRGHVIRLFTFEGTPYALISSAIGSGLGLVFGWAMVLLLAPSFDEWGFPLEYKFTPSGLIISYTLGVVFTLLVVFFSARRVSNLNIVGAIKDLPDPPKVGGGKAQLIVSLIMAFFGALLLATGFMSESFSSYALGASLLVIGVPLLSRRFGVPDRPAFTSIGIGLLAFWLTPAKYHPLTEESSTGPEMFILSGVMLVAGGVWLVIYNSDILLTSIMSIFGRSKMLAPILKTAISYPLQARFRTGMALAMFALIIFTLALMTSMNATIERSLDDTDRISGGFEIQTGVSFTNPIADMEDIINERGIGIDNFEAISAVSMAPVEMRQSGKDQEWELVPVSGLDVAYLDYNTFGFEMMTSEYSTPSEVWTALKNNPSLVVINPMFVPGADEGGPGPEIDLVIGEDQINLETEVLPDDIYIEMRNIIGEITEYQVIAVTDQLAFYAPFVALSRESLDAQVASEFLPTAMYWFETVSEDPDEVSALARALESNLREHGIDTVVVEDQINEIINMRNMFINLMMVFLGLGLIVGIAALGVIAARTVVERRQQIGMLRAIGFRQGMVQFSFLLESSFISLLGILIGVILGVALTYQIVPETGIGGLETYIPWDRIAIIVGIAYFASLTTTFLPAYQASRIYPADALRYE